MFHRVLGRDRPVLRSIGVTRSQPATLSAKRTLCFEMRQRHTSHETLTGLNWPCMVIRNDQLLKDFSNIVYKKVTIRYISPDLFYISRLVWKASSLYRVHFICEWFGPPVCNVFKTKDQNCRRSKFYAKVSSFSHSFSVLSVFTFVCVCSCQIFIILVIKWIILL